MSDERYITKDFFQTSYGYFPTRPKSCDGLIWCEIDNSEVLPGGVPGTRRELTRLNNNRLNILVEYLNNNR